MAATAITLPYIEVLKLGISTGVVAVFASQGLGWLIDRWKLKKQATIEATYLAAQLAASFENFAIRCAEQIANNSMYHDSGGEAGRPHTTLPHFDEFQDQTNWKTLDPALLSRCLSFPNELILGDSKIAFWLDIDPDPDLIRNACTNQAGVHGYRAWCLANDLRTKYCLPEFVPGDFSWDMMDVLNKHHNRELARVEKERRIKARRSHEN